MVINTSDWRLGTCELFESINRRSIVARHSVFYRFAKYNAWAESGFERWFFGVNVRDWLMTGESKGFDRGRRMHIGYPPCDNEYFEWVALLTAVYEARGSFCFAEIGAGWGRWMAAAVALCRQKRLPCSLIGVEAEAEHFEYMNMVLRDNGVDPAEHDLHHAAVSAENGEVLLTGVIKPRTEYGNRTIRLDELPAWSQIPDYAFLPVRGITIEALLEPHHLVDIVDMDIQGLEHEVLAPAFDTLDRKVKMIHIGTHSTEIERTLTSLFLSSGWLNAFSFPCQSRVETAFGPIAFDDGVQTWVNPKWPHVLPVLLDTLRCSERTSGFRMKSDRLP